MLEKALIAYGSPTLARLKLGSLFAVPCAYGTIEMEIRRLNGMLIPRGVRLVALRQGKERTLLYLYRERALDETLLRPDVRALLTSYGYEAFSAQSALRTLQRRLAGEREFPHEIGLFLGYPLGDVIGFIANGGRDCLCAGCWKVYTDVYDARRTFARLNKCRRIYGRLFAEGYPLSRLTVRTTE